MKKLTVKLRWSPEESIVVGQLAEVDRRVYLSTTPHFSAEGSRCRR